MSYRIVLRTHVAYHLPSEDPSTDEWTEYMADIGRTIDSIDGVFSLTDGGGPNSAQRAISVKFWEAQAKKVPIAVVTPSTIVVGMTVALSWFIKTQIRAFSPDNVDAAFDYLQLSSLQRTAVFEAVTEMRAQLLGTA
jgi:hypothetical protein